MAYLILPLFMILAQHVEASYVTTKSKFNNDSVRVKSWTPEDVHLCQGNTTHHTGWADISDHHLFFWHHEARHKPKEAPLMIWFQGGPGGTSMAGMFMEHGPCLIDGPKSTKFNPASWTELFNIVYLDQPAGVGNSYVDDVNNKTSYSERTEESSLDLVAFLKVFYEAFPQYTQRPLHLAGESYAGRYVPVLAATIIEFNGFFEPDSEERIPLRSLMVGNGYTSPRHVLPAIHEVGCSEYQDFGAFFNTSTCAEMAKHVDACEVLLTACEASEQKEVCERAGEVCSKEIMVPLESENHSMYDRRVECEPGECYPDADDTIAFLNSAEIFNGSLEAGEQTGGRVRKFDFINPTVLTRFTESGDFWASSTGALSKILSYSSAQDQKVDVLYYAGTADLICNGAGVHATLRDTRWEKRAHFRAANWQELPWTALNGKRAGRSKMIEGLWYIEIEDAGHMAPRDQPVSTLHMVENWLSYIESSVIPTFPRTAKGGSIDDDQPSRFKVQMPL